MPDGLEVYAVSGQSEKELGLKKALSNNWTLLRVVQDARPPSTSTNMCGDILDYIACCPGVGSHTLMATQSPDPKNIKGYLDPIAQRGPMRRFIVSNYMDRGYEAVRYTLAWITRGKIRRKVHLVGVITSAPEDHPL
ncbi:hypothetical protein AURDEDRAFT_120830 [Auricularia subglabra TFB-10046 SS5]|nr:hypothetical protein AURDEDRAFT_120830 [Auricularia subglabra TFB-10046 SS5]